MPCACKHSADPTPIAPPPSTSARACSGAVCKALRANRTACQPQAIGSARLAANSENPSGTVTKFSNGIEIYSANPPSRGGMEMIRRSGHRLSRPSRQARHVPQETNGFTVTRRPASGPWAIVPATSCPKMSGAGRRSSWPKNACISEPQIPTPATLIKTSPRSGCGSGISWNDKTSGPI